MVIGFDYRMAGVRNAGLGRYASALLFAMLAEKTDHIFKVFYRPNEIDSADLRRLEEYGSRVKLIEAPFRHYSFGEQLGFLRLLKKTKMDLMHFPNFNMPIWYSGPFVVTIHDMVHHRISGHKKSRFLHFLAYKKVIETAAHKSKRIITVSEDAKRDIIKLLNVDPEKIHVVYEAAFLHPQLDEVVNEVKERFLLRKPYFLFVGTLERKKNIIGLCRGFNVFLEKSGLDMDLVICGKRDMHYPEIRHDALAVVKRDRVVFTGFVEDAELAALYQGAYAYVNASVHEGFGLPGVEAMCLGLPLLVSNTTVFNEIYDNAAIYFNPESPDDIADKMALIARDQKFHRDLQLRSIKRGGVFDWAISAKQTLDIYESA